jgi:hypothetical protein
MLRLYQLSSRFQQEVRGMFKHGMIFMGVLFVVMSGATQVHAADYVGVKKCKMCHMKQFKSWETTKMAKVFELLKPGVRAEAKKAAGVDPNKDYTGDATCLPCHTVNGSADMPNVQCESCHGAGSDYMKVMMTNRDYKREEVIAKGLILPDEAACRKCHNEKSPFYKEFNFKEQVAQGIHEHIPLKKAH